MNIFDVVKKPIITEKSTAQMAQSKYTFEVDKRASKRDIKRAVEKLFNVKVLAVKTATVRGKKVRTGRRRVLSKGSDWKKATVTLKEGNRIEAFEVGG